MKKFFVCFLMTTVIVLAAISVFHICGTDPRSLPAILGGIVFPATVTLWVLNLLLKRFTGKSLRFLEADSKSIDFGTIIAVIVAVTIVYMLQYFGSLVHLAIDKFWFWALLALFSGVIAKIYSKCMERRSRLNP